MKRQPLIQDFTRGGQVLLHNVRMLAEVLRYLIRFCLLLLVAVNAYWFYSHTTAYERYVLTRVVMAKIYNAEHVMSFRLPNGQSVAISAATLVAKPTVQHLLDRVREDAWKGFWFSMKTTGGLTCLVLIYLIYAGRQKRKQRYRRGSQVIPSKALCEVLKEEQAASCFKIAHVPFLKDSETKHILISGSSGTGKTVAMLELLDQIRAKQQRAIVYDKMGIYLKHFYRPETDIILNPLDARSPAWSVFSEGRYPSDYDSIAAALMPMHHHAPDPFWVNGARTIFSCLAVKLHQEGRKDNQAFLKLMLNNDLEGLGKVLKGTPAETLVNEKSDKTAFSVLSVLATYVRSLLYLSDQGADFSIRKWVEDDKAGSFLFVASRADQHETLKPLISGWLEIATNALLSLEPNPTRRIWTILDELPSLHRLPSLPSALAESRQFGGCMVLSIQSIAQLRDIYGKDGAEALSSLCNTRLFFRTPDPVTAEWVSQALGQTEVDENKEGLSYGAHESRDGVSLHSQTFLRPVVLPSEILALEDLTAYLRLPGQWPITQVKLTPRTRTSAIKAFVPRGLHLPASTSPQTIPTKTAPEIPSEANEQGLLPIGNQITRAQNHAIHRYP